MKVKIKIFVKIILYIDIKLFSSFVFLDNLELNSVVLYIDAPFYDDPAPPNGLPGQAYFKVF